MADAGVIVIVDDDPAILDSLKLLLEVAGHSVVTFLSTNAFLIDRTTQPACVILDQDMPEMTGLEVVKRLRSEGSGVPILLVTDVLSPVIHAYAAQLGIEKVLEKPAKESELMSFVGRHY